MFIRIRATRQVNCDLHLAAFRAMLPSFFISDRVNYARYGSACLLDMSALESTHPGIIPEPTTRNAVPGVCPGQGY